MLMNICGLSAGLFCLSREYSFFIFRISGSIWRGLYTFLQKEKNWKKKEKTDIG
jgi:hypothetical protein